jgi:hypothetical protein
MMARGLAWKPLRRKKVHHEGTKDTKKARRGKRAGACPAPKKT